MSSHKSPSYSYKMGCRCEGCRAWKRKSTQSESIHPTVRSREWRKANLERSREGARRYARENAEKMFATRIKRDYGLTMEQYNFMQNSCGEKCMICGGGPKGPRGRGERKLHVDHSHTTGKVRGLLCGSCNTGLGLFRDSPRALQAAIAYLNRNGDIFQ